MPPRISGTRVEHVMVGGDGKAKPVNPNPQHPGFDAIAHGVARRQKKSKDDTREQLKDGAKRAARGYGKGGS